MTTYLAIFGVAALGVLGGKLAFNVGTRIEDRRRSASQLAGILRSHGFQELPAILEDYMVQDYSGMARRVKDLAAKYANPATLESELNAVGSQILTRRLNDPEVRARVKTLVAQHEAATPSSASAPTSGL